VKDIVAEGDRIAGRIAEWWGAANLLDAIEQIHRR
jgi:hypothetical protein